MNVTRSEVVSLSQLPPDPAADRLAQQLIATVGVKQIIEIIGLRTILEYYGLPRIIAEMGLDKFLSQLTPDQLRELNQRLP